MIVEYLKVLSDNPAGRGNSSFSNIAIGEEEILELEALYNNSNVFPKALRELLYLAGSYCYVLDYGLNETQKELQEFVRTEMQDEGREMARPFYVIDIYNASDQFLFVYLDEGDDPAVYEGHYYDSMHRTHWITSVDRTLSAYINAMVERTNTGQNPF